MKRLLALLVLAPLALPTVGVAATFSGTLAERHDDPVPPVASGGTPAARDPEASYVLRRAQGTIELEGDQDERLVGQRVRVDDASSSSGVQGRARAVDSTRVGAAAEPGPRKVAVLLVNFTDNRSTPVTADQVRTRVWTAADSVNRYYQQQSNGAVSLVGRDRVDGDVYGWFELPIASTGCDFESFASQARQAAAARNIDLSGYDHVQYFFPTVADCKFGGVGEFPGRQTWINGYLQTGLIAHELGHNMGAHHAGSISCTDASGTRVAISGSCAFDEYGDPFDAMGVNSKLMSSWHRAQLAQLPAGGQRTITTSGSYELVNANDPTASGSKLILIPRKRAGQPTRDFYALEIRRQWLPFDTWTATQPPATGVSIRLVPTITDLLPSRLVDTVPATTTVGDAPLQPGSTFSDPAYGIQIRNVGGTEPAVLDVTVPVVPDTIPPSAPTALATVLNGSAVDVSWGASTDDEAFGHYEVTRDGGVIATTQETSFRDTATAGLDTAAYRIVAVDRAGNRASGGQSTVRFPDTVPPGAPTDVRVTKTTFGVVVNWTAAADNRGIERYHVLRDAVDVTNVNTTSYADGVTPGVYAYAVRAVDNAGNPGPASAPVTVDTRTSSGSGGGASSTTTSTSGTRPPSTTTSTATSVPRPPIGPPSSTTAKGPTPVPSAKRVRLVSPKPLGNVVRVPRSGRLTFQATGARRLSIRLGAKTVKLVKRARYTYVLPRRYRRAGRVVVRVTAGGEGFARAATITLVIRRGNITSAWA